SIPLNLPFSPLPFPALPSPPATPSCSTTAAADPQLLARLLAALNDPVKFVGILASQITAAIATNSGTSQSLATPPSANTPPITTPADLEAAAAAAVAAAGLSAAALAGSLGCVAALTGGSDLGVSKDCDSATGTVCLFDDVCLTSCEPKCVSMAEICSEYVERSGPSSLSTQKRTRSESPFSTTYAESDEDHHADESSPESPLLFSGRPTKRACPSTRAAMVQPFVTAPMMSSKPQLPPKDREAELAKKRERERKRREDKRRAEEERRKSRSKHTAAAIAARAAAQAETAARAAAEVVGSVDAQAVVESSASSDSGTSLPVSVSASPVLDIASGLPSPPAAVHNGVSESSLPRDSDTITVETPAETSVPLAPTSTSTQQETPSTPPPSPAKTSPPSPTNTSPPMPIIIAVTPAPVSSAGSTESIPASRFHSGSKATISNNPARPRITPGAVSAMVRLSTPSPGLVRKTIPPSIRPVSRSPTTDSSDDCASLAGTESEESISVKAAGALLIGRPMSALLPPGQKRTFVCSVRGCGKSYKNANGLKYHEQHGHYTDTGDPTLNAIINKPYMCTIPNCGKRYKNPNGLKYHIEHAHSNFLSNLTGESPSATRTPVPKVATT
ncbi:hypothetical protein HDU93_001349, partial [Gonapodya sp. JEL0774]